MKNRKSKKRSYFSYLWKCLAVSAVFVGYTAADTVRIINQTYIADFRRKRVVQFVAIYCMLLLADSVRFIIPLTKGQ